MLALTFQIGPNRLALGVREIKEVVPRVNLKPAPFGPSWLAGVFVYRGQVVPVVDLHKLIAVGNCPDFLSSRIILVPLPGDPRERLIGLLAGQVADIRELPSMGNGSSGNSDSSRPDLGPVIVDAEGIMHLAVLDRVIPAAYRQQLSALCHSTDS
ncbi:chemotaxis protein CheW [Zavarzinella formosa]|uniref:chemotaxis protein CheW n=1 Tax=Zavarzinella formosa TaxID=360055 RepID=UPI00030C3BF4|nr:chemotaxis protein CheW [Zavarzinella formosa]